MAQISLLKTQCYNLQEVQGVIQQHLKLLRVAQIAPTARVVIKPNLIMRCSPQRTATTNPVLVEAVIRQLQELGARDITIAESPGGLYTPQLLQATYEQTGIKAVAQRCGVKLNLDCGSRLVHAEQEALCREFDIIDPIAEADYLVNLCKLKTHCMTTLSCGVKNLFGSIPGLLKPQLHYRFPDGEHFAQMLVDLSLLVKPALTIVDAVDAMEGDGPTGGSARHVGVTAAALGENIYALDLVMAYLIGLSPDQVPMLADSIRRGLSPADPSEVEVLGDTAEQFVIHDFLMPATKKLNFTGNVPRPIAAFIRRIEGHLAPKPKVRQADCVGCGRCAESCPAKTIEMANGKAKIELSRCIRCFCCHEMCPVKAISIQAMPIFRFLSK